MGKTHTDSGEKSGAGARPAKKPPPLAVRLLVSATTLGIGLICLLYLIFPTMGIVELIPDWFPVVGNLDEAGATAMLLMVCSYFGFEPTRVGRALRAWSKGEPKRLPETAEEGRA